MADLVIHGQRQLDLVVCKLHPTHRWVWTCCYRGFADQLLGRSLKEGERFMAKLSCRELKEVPMSNRATLTGNKMIIMGIIWGIAWYLGSHYDCMGQAILAVGIAACGAFIANGLSDAAHHKS